MASTVPHLLGAKIGRIGLKTLAVDLTVNYAAAQVEENDESRKRIEADQREAAAVCKLLSLQDPADLSQAYRAALSRISTIANRRIESELKQIARRRKNIEHARELARFLEALRDAA